jgi:hypothetical protein
LLTVGPVGPAPSSELLLAQPLTASVVAAARETRMAAERRDDKVTS